MAAAGSLPGTGAWAAAFAVLGVAGLGGGFAGMEPKPEEDAGGEKVAEGPSGDESEGGDTDKAKARAECPFCQFMRAGPCGAEFTEWEGCLDEHENDDYPTLCSAQTIRLTECMKKHKDYYGDFLPKEDEKLERPEAEPAAPVEEQK